MWRIRHILTDMQLDVSKMEIRKFKLGEENSLINLWKEVFPNDPPHNEPSSVIKSKLEISYMREYYIYKNCRLTFDYEISYFKNSDPVLYSIRTCFIFKSKVI